MRAPESACSAAGPIGHRFLTIVLLLLSVAGCGDPELATSPPLDALEQELELGRHQRLVEQISAGSLLPATFTTDGCSGGLSLAWQQMSQRYPAFAEAHGDVPPWQDCCVSHDRAYHLGPRVAGRETLLTALESFALRRDADLRLRACVVDTGLKRSADLQSLYGLTQQQVQAWYETIADLMYRAVRLGGIPCTPESWRWAYGWPACDTEEGPG